MTAATPAPPQNTHALAPAPDPWTGLRPRTPPTPALRSIDLFSGAGGLSLGLAWAGFTAVAAAEADPDAARTFELNIAPVVARTPEGAPARTDEIDFSPYTDIDLIAGGPPCQAFSRLGKQDAQDPRRGLWREFMRAVEIIRPRAFLMENVVPFLNSSEAGELEQLSARLGYALTAGVLDASRHGVPQQRKRAFLIGTRGCAPAALPRPEKAALTVRNAFASLSTPGDGDPLHILPNVTDINRARYMVIPPGGNRFDLMRERPDLTPPCWLRRPDGLNDVFGRMHWEQPSVTIRTAFTHPEKGRYLHPEAHRPLTLREGARLQTFPDAYAFTEKGSGWKAHGFNRGM